MASGGARARSGPAPDPNALRRDRKDDAGWTVLPAEGRKGKKPPSFPLIDPSARELQIWVKLWKLPQAILWEKNQQELAVAFHVRTMCEAERADAQANLRTLVRQQAGELLLTIPAMYSARVRIAEDEVAAKRTQAKVEPAKNSARDRLKAVNGA
jgi:hypothetical protein